MRTDLTLRARDGLEYDLAVEAPDPTTFAAVSAELTRSVPGVQPNWSGRQRVHAESVFGRGQLRSGAVLTSDPGAGDDATAPGARLEIVGGPGSGHGVTIGRRSLVVGRESSCDLVLTDARASRRHAVVTVAGAKTTVRDLGSTNGTRIDDAPVRGQATVPPGSVIVVGDSFLAVTAEPGQSALLRDGSNGTILVNRPPREGARPERRLVVLPTPLGRRLSPRTPWIAALLPAIAGVALAWVTRSVQFLAFAALAPVALLAGSFGDRLHWRRARRRAAAAHRHAIAMARFEISAAIAAETALRRTADPDPAALRRIACTPTSRLWERRRTDDDLLRVRIGLGSLPSAVRVERAGTVDHAAIVAAVPGTVDLARGPVGIAAPASVRDALARWIITQLAVLTSPDDVEFALLLSDDTSWRWTRWLPHLRGRVATTDAEREAVVDDLADLVRSRRGTQHTARVWSGTWIVVVLDRIRSLGSHPQLGSVIAEGLPVGLTALCLDDSAQGLPGACTQVMRPTDEVGNTVGVGNAAVVADRVDVDWAEQISRALTPLCDAHADASAALPIQCRLADLSGFELSPDLSDADQACTSDVLTRWRRSDGSASTVLGIGPDGPLSIDLDRDGPHALIAGTTGAGKSELLQTLVTGLAIRHPPSELTFLLIDYKGGAAFAECGELPHTVGLVTDLDNHLTIRVLASLNSEIRRRERLFADAHAHDLAAYRAGGADLPRLVLVVDEFATLADELADFVPGLVGIAQRGRSLGLHLVLATQRPARVVSPEIRANTALRIALRVTDAAESIEVIDAAHAASIHPRTPGRGYLRLGTTTVPFQTARVAMCAPNGAQDRIRAIILDDWRRAPAATQGTQRDSDLQRYVRSMCLAASDQPPVRRPWLPPLPDRISLSEISTSDAPPALVPIGLVDLPARQCQEPLEINLGTGGSVLIVGGARSGRSTALVALALAAARRCSPADLHMHAIDCAGSSLSALRALPHVGTLARLDDGFDVAAGLLRRLLSDLARRRDTQRHRPVLVLFVDGWEQLLAASEEYDGGRTVERFLAVLRDAPAAAASVVITGGRAALAPRLASQIPLRLLLRLHDPADYLLAGLDAHSIPSHTGAGRGVRVEDGAEFQFARPGPTAEQAHLAAECAELWRDTAKSALTLRSLPSHVTVAELPACRGRFVLGVGGDEASPIAIDPQAGAARLLVAGPARSGRSSLLCSVLRQTRTGLAGTGLVVAAPSRSRLAAAARELGLPVLGPRDRVPELTSQALLLVDDADAFADTDVGDALADWVRTDVAGRAAIVAARTDNVAVTFRGLTFQVRQSQCGVLLQPGPVDGELLGASLPRARPSMLPGRGVLIPDPAWGLGHSPLPVQVALP